MSWRLRVTAYAVIVCIVLCFMLGAFAMRHVITVHHGEGWWFPLIFLVPSVLALVGIYAPGGDE